MKRMTSYFPLNAGDSTPIAKQWDGEYRRITYYKRSVWIRLNLITVEFNTECDRMHHFVMQEFTNPRMSSE